jgi:outer membrane murein-binding lipoprotein Lpp
MPSISNVKAIASRLKQNSSNREVQELAAAVEDLARVVEDVERKAKDAADDAARAKRAARG